MALWAPPPESVFYVARVSEEAPDYAVGSPSAKNAMDAPAPAPSSARRWSITLAGGSGDSSVRSVNTLPVEQFQGSRSCNVFAGVCPPGIFGISSRTMTVQSAPLATKAWGNGVKLDLSFAPSGHDGLGWRFDGGFETSSDTLKAQLRGPLAGSITYGKSTCLASFGSTCLSSVTPVTGTLIQIPSTLNIVGLSAPGLNDAFSVQFDNLQQVSALYTVRGGASVGRVVRTPVGALDLRTGVSLSLSSSNTAERQYFAGAPYEYPPGVSASAQIIGGFSFHEVGWDAAPVLTVEASSRFGSERRLGWAAFAEAGARYFNDDLHDGHGGSGHLVDVRGEGRFGGELRYFATPRLTLLTRIEDRLTSYLSSQQPSTDRVDVALSYGEVVKLRAEQTTRFSVGASFAF